MSARRAVHRTPGGSSDQLLEEIKGMMLEGREFIHYPSLGSPPRRILLYLKSQIGIAESTSSLAAPFPSPRPQNYTLVWTEPPQQQQGEQRHASIQSATTSNGGSISLDTICELSLGRQSSNLLQQASSTQEDRCFSIISSSERIGGVTSRELPNAFVLDLEAVSENLRVSWVYGLTALLKLCGVPYKLKPGRKTAVKRDTTATTGAAATPAASPASAAAGILSPSSLSSPPASHQPITPITKRAYAEGVDPNGAQRGLNFTSPPNGSKPVEEEKTPAAGLNNRFATLKSPSPPPASSNALSSPSASSYSLASPLTHSSHALIGSPPPDLVYEISVKCRFLSTSKLSPTSAAQQQQQQANPIVCVFMSESSLSSHIDISSSSIKFKYLDQTELLKSSNHPIFKKRFHLQPSRLEPPLTWATLQNTILKFSVYDISGEVIHEEDRCGSSDIKLWDLCSEKGLGLDFVYELSVPDTAFGFKNGQNQQPHQAMIILKAERKTAGEIEAAKAAARAARAMAAAGANASQSHASNLSPTHATLAAFNHHSLARTPNRTFQMQSPMSQQTYTHMPSHIQQPLQSYPPLTSPSASTLPQPSPQSMRQQQQSFDEPTRQKAMPTAAPQGRSAGPPPQPPVQADALVNPSAAGAEFPQLMHKVQRMMMYGRSFTRYMVDSDPREYSVFFRPASGSDLQDPINSAGFLFWSPAPKREESPSRRIPLNLIIDVTLGKGSLAFQSHFGRGAHEDRCFSVIGTAGFSLDLEASTQKQCVAWAFGIMSLLKKTEPTGTSPGERREPGESEPTPPELPPQVRQGRRGSFTIVSNAPTDRDARQLVAKQRSHNDRLGLSQAPDPLDGVASPARPTAMPPSSPSVPDGTFSSPKSAGPNIVAKTSQILAAASHQTPTVQRQVAPLRRPAHITEEEWLVLPRVRQRFVNGIPIQRHPDHTQHVFFLEDEVTTSGQGIQPGGRCTFHLAPMPYSMDDDAITGASKVENATSSFDLANLTGVYDGVQSSGFWSDAITPLLQPPTETKKTTAKKHDISFTLVVQPTGQHPVRTRPILYEFELFHAISVQEKVDLLRGLQLLWKAYFGGASLGSGLSSQLILHPPTPTCKVYLTALHVSSILEVASPTSTITSPTSASATATPAKSSNALVAAPSPSGRTQATASGFLLILMQKDAETGSIIHIDKAEFIPLQVPTHVNGHATSDGSISYPPKDFTLSFQTPFTIHLYDSQLRAGQELIFELYEFAAGLFHTHIEPSFSLVPPTKWNKSMYLVGSAVMDVGAVKIGLERSKDLSVALINSERREIGYQLALANSSLVIKAMPPTLQPLTLAMFGGATATAPLPASPQAALPPPPNSMPALPSVAPLPPPPPPAPLSSESEPPRKMLSPAQEKSAQSAGVPLFSPMPPLPMSMTPKESSWTSPIPPKSLDAWSTFTAGRSNANTATHPKTHYASQTTPRGFVSTAAQTDPIQMPAPIRTKEIEVRTITVEKPIEPKRESRDVKTQTTPRRSISPEPIAAPIVMPQLPAVPTQQALPLPPKPEYVSVQTQMTPREEASVQPAAAEIDLDQIRDDLERARLLREAQARASAANHERELLEYHERWVWHDDSAHAQPHPAWIGQPAPAAAEPLPPLVVAPPIIFQNAPTVNRSNLQRSSSRTQVIEILPSPPPLRVDGEEFPQPGGIEIGQGVLLPPGSNSAHDVDVTTRSLAQWKKVANAVRHSESPMLDVPQHDLLEVGAGEFARVFLQVRCEGLFFAHVDEMIETVVGAYHVDPSRNKMDFATHSDRIQDSLDPNFNRPLELMYVGGAPSLYALSLYDVHSTHQARESCRLGSAFFFLDNHIHFPDKEFCYYLSNSNSLSWHDALVENQSRIYVKTLDIQKLLPGDVGAPAPVPIGAPVTPAIPNHVRHPSTNAIFGGATPQAQPSPRMTPRQQPQPEPIPLAASAHAPQPIQLKQATVLPPPSPSTGSAAPGHFPPTTVQLNPVSEASDELLLFGSSVEGALLHQAFYGAHSPDLDPEIPLVLPSLLRNIIDTHGHKSEGIFRISPSSSALSPLVDELEDGGYGMEEPDPNLNAALVKLWLRKMKDPIIPFAQYDAMIAIGRQPYFDVHSNDDDRDAVYGVMRSLTSPALKALWTLLLFLQRIISKPEWSQLNKMSAKAFGVVFAPSFVRLKDGDLPDNLMKEATNAQSAARFVERLIEATPHCFPPECAATHGIAAENVIMFLFAEEEEEVEEVKEEELPPLVLAPKELLREEEEPAKSSYAPIAIPEPEPEPEPIAIPEPEPEPIPVPVVVAKPPSPVKEPEPTPIAEPEPEQPLDDEEYQPLLFGTSVPEALLHQASFGVHSPDLDEEIPLIIPALLRNIVDYRGHKTEGIFRIAPPASILEPLLEQLEDGDYGMDEPNPHSNAALLKLWLRTLSEPIIPFEQYDTMLSIGRLPQASIKQDPTKFIAGMYQVTGSLASPNAKALLVLLLFFQRILRYERHTHMNVKAYGEVLAPLFVRHSSGVESPSDRPAANSFVERLIQSAPACFEHGPTLGAASDTVMLSLFPPEEEEEEEASPRPAPAPAPVQPRSETPQSIAEANFPVLPPQAIPVQHQRAPSPVKSQSPTPTPISNILTPAQIRAPSPAQQRAPSPAQTPVRATPPPAAASSPPVYQPDVNLPREEQQQMMQNYLISNMLRGDVGMKYYDYIDGAQFKNMIVAYRIPGMLSPQIEPLDPNENKKGAICWSRDGRNYRPEDSIRLLEIKKIIDGKIESPTWVKGEAKSLAIASCCFSIVSKVRTLDLEAVTPRQKLEWIYGLRCLMGAIGRGPKANVTPLLKPMPPPGQPKYNPGFQLPRA